MLSERGRPVDAWNGGLRKKEGGLSSCPGEWMVMWSRGGFVLMGLTPRGPRWSFSSQESSWTHRLEQNTYLSAKAFEYIH